MAKEIWQVESEFDPAKAKHQASMLFPIGEPNVNFFVFRFHSTLRGLK